MKRFELSVGRRYNETESIDKKPNRREGLRSVFSGHRPSADESQTKKKTKKKQKRKKNRVEANSTVTVKSMENEREWQITGFLYWLKIGCKLLQKKTAKRIREDALENAGNWLRF